MAFSKNFAKKRFQKLKTRKKTQGSLNLEPLEMRAMMTTNAIVDGDWFDPNTWDNGVPDDSVRAIIGHDVTVELDGTLHEAKELVIHGDLVVPEEDVSTGESDKSLTTRWIHINSGGELIVGSEVDRYDAGTFTVTLTGTDVTSNHVVETNMGGMNAGTMNVSSNDGFLMTAMGGSIQLFGEDKLSFTKLAATASPGNNTIVVENVIERNYDKGAMNGDAFVTTAEDDGALNWTENDQIVIASSSYDYADEEVRIITNVADNGDGTSTLTLNAPLEKRHYGEIEVYGETAAAGTNAASQTYEIDLRAEVALLSRNVKIQGLDTQDTDVEFGDRANAVIQDRVRSSDLSPHEPVPPTQVANGVGGHIMLMPNSGDIHVDGVQLDRMGQASQKGRYPIHWHLNDSRPNDFLKNSSITNSNNRGVTIHGTSDLKIEGVVLHDVHGHGFFFEDAVETGNELVANIAFGIHTVGGNDKNFANPGGTDPFVVDTHDSVL
ncbi:MAG: G8 domain-containing protein, partial [Planctomycetota bacterium]